MDKVVLNFLTRHRVAVFSINMPDGSVHAASVHFANVDNPLELIVYTDDKTRKVQNLLNNKTSPAAMVVGFSEEEWVEMQMSGTARIASVDEVEKYGATYGKKFETEVKLDPGEVLVIFTPSWYRYTESRRDPKVKIEETL